MHCLQEFDLNFDPNEKEGVVKKIFASRAARFIWVCVKSGHLTCDEDYEAILRCGMFVDKVRSGKRLIYRKFLRLVGVLTEKFGRALIDGSSAVLEYEIDHEFWSDVFRAIIGDRHIKINIMKNGKKEELF